MTPKRRIIPIFIPHSGCKHDCVFCNQRAISGVEKPIAADGILHIVENGILKNETAGEMPQHLEIAFYGGSFTAIPLENQTALLEAAQSFISGNPYISVRVSTRPDHIDGPIVERLMRHGVKTIELGAQSMCDDVLLASGRGHTSSDVENAAKIIKEYGLSLVLQMMTGLPGDDYEKSLYTTRRISALEPDGVRIYPTVVVRGTKLHEMWLRGEYIEHTLDDAVDICAEICEIYEEEGIAVIRIGLNPNEGLSAEGAAAGAYHPALGELVYSRVFYNKAAALLKGVAPGSCVTITVPKGRVSIMAGHRRQNIDRLKTEFSLREIKIVESSDANHDANLASKSVEITVWQEYNNFD